MYLYSHLQGMLKVQKHDAISYMAGARDSDGRKLNADADIPNSSMRTASQRCR